MSTLRIAYRNEANCVDPTEFANTVAALDKQLREHVSPVWGIEASCHVLADPNDADCIAHVQHKCDVKTALAYHTVIAAGKPMIIVGLDVCKKSGVSWSSAASHENIETAGDANCNLSVRGPINGHGKKVSIDQENCDPVQDSSYKIDGVEVSNFVFPAWFKSRSKSQLDQMGLVKKPFTLLPGGYIAYTDPVTGQSSQYFADDRAKAIRAPKVAAGVHRGRIRAMNPVSLVQHIVALGQELGQDLKKDPDGKVRITLQEAGQILARLGIIVTDLAT